MLKWLAGIIVLLGLIMAGLVFHRPIIDTVWPPEAVKMETVELLDSETYALELSSPNPTEYQVKAVHINGVGVHASFIQTDTGYDWGDGYQGLPAYGYSSGGVLIDTAWIETRPREKFSLVLEADKTTNALDPEFDIAEVRLNVTRREAIPVWLKKALIFSGKYIPGFEYDVPEAPAPSTRDEIDSDDPDLDGADVLRSIEAAEDLLKKSKNLIDTQIELDSLLAQSAPYISPERSAVFNEAYRLLLNASTREELTAHSSDTVSALKDAVQDLDAEAARNLKDTLAKLIEQQTLTMEAIEAAEAQSE